MIQLFHAIRLFGLKTAQILHFLLKPEDEALCTHTCKYAAIPPPAPTEPHLSPESTCTLPESGSQDTNAKTIGL